MLKYSHIVIIYAVGAALSFVSLGFKPEDFPYTKECSLASVALQAFAAATLVFKIIKQKGFKEK
jgi:hypothetical protein